MDVIADRKGKKSGERGVTVHILRQKSDEQSKVVTVKNSTVREVYNKVKFALNNIDAVNNVFIVNKQYISGGDLYGE